MGLHQTKMLCTAKETINKIKRQPTEWENIFANTFDKELIFQNLQRTYKTQHQKPIQFINGQRT